VTPNEAKDLLEKTKFIAEIEKLIMDKMLDIVNTSQYDYEERESLYKSIKAMEEIKEHFQSLAVTDKIKRNRFYIA
tara:strand:+ start:108 stop:335 length:228 start_codon:yes stop_codon:yes gene_type:complete